MTLLVFFMMVGNAFAFDITLGWDVPENDPDLVKGYEVCYGTTSGQYDNCRASLDGHGVNQMTIENLTDGTMYYFAVRTVGWTGTRSGFSNEVRTDGYTLPPDGWTPDAPTGCYIITVY